MSSVDTPYRYGDERPSDWAVADGRGPDGEMVIVEGASMSYRSYRRRRG